MVANEFKAAFKLAASDATLQDHATDMFDGFALRGFGPITATVEQMAWLIRWQGQQLNGGWDMEAVNQVRDCLRRTCTIVGA